MVTFGIVREAFNPIIIQQSTNYVDKTPKIRGDLAKDAFLTLHPKIHIPHFEDKEGNKKFYAEINEPFAMRHYGSSRMKK